jgi:hypothetical protein
MKMFSEEQLLDIKFRVKVIKEINGGASKGRKREAIKRHEVYKDQTVKWVLEKLQAEGLKKQTLMIMQNRASNISICRKVIEKLSRCYNNGVTREAGTEAENILISEMARLLDLDEKMKKCDRYLNLFKNVFPMVVPELCYQLGDVKRYRLKIKTLMPWQYDVIEDARDPESPAALILSDYVDQSVLGLPINSASTDQIAMESHPVGDTAIADSSSAIRENHAQTYIWWSAKYHFTTDEKGNIIKSVSPENLLNPIQMLPGASMADDQDGMFWASGGQDLVDGAILVNTLITDMFAIAFMQGWGQIVITGLHVPEQLEVGPHNALVLRYDPKKDDPKPEVTVVNADPPLDSWMASIEQYVALLLSTNNLSPSSVSVKLDTSNFPSGIAMLVEKSEATGSVEAKQKKLARGERQLWEASKRWHNTLLASNSLDDEFAKLGPVPETVTPMPKFHDTKEVVTEGEKLDNLKKRKDLGLNSDVELIMMDNPGMTEEQAKEKLLKIRAEKVEQGHKEATNVIKSEEDDGDSEGGV